MRDELKNLNYFFNAKTVAVIGASRTAGRVGNVILRNFVEGKFKGQVFAVNPHAKEIAGVKSYKSIKDIPGSVDLAVVVVPAQVVSMTLKECVAKGVKAVTVISSGFKEIGRADLEEQVQETLKGTGVRLIGVNCLGVFDTRTGVDTMFLPPFRLTRPQPGGISYISQSGAVGSTTLDWASSQGMGFAKFISYGNATDVDDADLIEFLGEDYDTKVIISYLEGVVDGRKFFETAKAVSKKKPIIVLKAGYSEEGS
ncbi:MAG: CoA-binding protein, partial [Candidatus Diapherotrites archaeon]|nr:CoA-binding protein [Candidatus Diapherotrites archaeon]